jgi:hypothetical protein
MAELRLARDRGYENRGWLDFWHTFSFADYYDPEHMGYGRLRVINEDRIAAALEEGVYQCKPNLRELRQLTGQPLEDEPAWRQAAAELVSSGKAEIVAQRARARRRENSG